MLIQLIDGVPTGHPVTEENFRQLYPNVSFPLFLTPESVESYGFGIYEYSSAPEPAKYEKIVEATPALDSSGVWKQQWKRVSMTLSERQQADLEKSESVRSNRNQRLANCDWTQGKDILDAVSQTWAMYRQELRDVPEQAGFPWEVIWPEEPK